MITPSILRLWSACWTGDQIAAAFGTRAEISPRDVARDESASLEDRLWVLCRAIAYLDEDAARLFAAESALRVVHLSGDEDDQAQYLGFMNGLVQIQDLPVDQRTAARSAAWSGARSAAWGEAWSAELQKAIDRALYWLGDYADGWEES